MARARNKDSQAVYLVSRRALRINSCKVFVEEQTTCLQLLAVLAARHVQLVQGPTATSVLHVVGHICKRDLAFQVVRPGLIRMQRRKHVFLVTLTVSTARGP